MVHEELLAAGSNSRVETWWQTQPPERRRAITTLVTIIVAVALAIWGIDALRKELAERARKDRADVSAELLVTADSAYPAGGSLWFGIALTNSGPLPIRIDSVSQTSSQWQISAIQALRGRPGSGLPRTLEPGQTRAVTLSAVVDCLAWTTQPMRTTTMSVWVGPQSGKDRTIEVPVVNGARLSDAADLVCAQRPQDESVQLSGPILER